ncbi:hypothetical protein V1477_009347 [Vespula maculifrons]|uniref:Secreted protein n=1 Tax=Vespula maculifrons TaxID=7453 RepID=A0ABD2C9K5_VESMC
MNICMKLVHIATQLIILHSLAMIFTKIVICFVWQSLIKQEKELPITCSYGLYFEIHFQYEERNNISILFTHALNIFVLTVLKTMSVV